MSQNRRRGRATVETQRVQIQILGGLREGGVRRRLEGSAKDNCRVASRQRVVDVSVSSLVEQRAGRSHGDADTCYLREHFVSIHA
jgi:hypothetical protein